MSDAKVAFHRYEDSHRWSRDRNSLPAGEEQAFSFQCPKHDRRCGDLVIAGKTGHAHDPNNANGGIAQWQWDGNREKPTFSPSIDCKGCWHGYIRAGRAVDCQGKDEP